MKNLCFVGPSHSRQEYNFGSFDLFLYKLGT
jgi:hypothetical protein